MVTLSSTNPPGVVQLGWSEQRRYRLCQTSTKACWWWKVMMLCEVWEYHQCWSSDGSTSSVFCQHWSALCTTNHLLIFIWSRSASVSFWWHPSFMGKCKGNVDLYSMSSWTLLMCSDDDHTVLPTNNTISAFTRKDSPGGATTHICIENAWVQLTTYLLTPRGWMAELTMLADIQQTVLPQTGYPSTAHHGAGQGKFAGHRTTS